MSNKQMLGSRVKELLAGVSDHGVDHLVEVETDLVQTTLLLAYGNTYYSIIESFFSVFFISLSSSLAISM